MLVDDLRGIGLFAGLAEEQLSELAAAGDELTIEPGAALFREGAPAEYWFVLLDGSVDLTRRVGREDVHVARMEQPGQWAGGFKAWDEGGAYIATGRGLAPGRMLRVPASALRSLMENWAPVGVHIIDGIFHTVRSFESTIRQRDSLVTLGTLAAGLAHELNNPAAAATRASASLEEACDRLLTSLRDLGKGRISPDQFLALDTLRKGVDPSPRPVDPLDVMDAEEALSEWLRAHGVERDWTIGPALASAGVDVAWCERALETLGEGGLETGLEWVASTISVASLITEIKESTSRVSGLVAAVRSYTQLDRASREEVDVTEGLESTLLVLGHKLRGDVQGGAGITVVRDYEAALPKIDAHPGELNQVWTNLIDNAIDAMEGSGVLRLTTHTDGDGVVVEVLDTGPGIPPDVAARAFEAFYTTKDIGKGTGLGLDIARRIIVERHHGTISIASAHDGGTVVRVRLPLRGQLD